MSSVASDRVASVTSRVPRADQTADHAAIPRVSTSCRPLTRASQCRVCSTCSKNARFSLFGNESAIRTLIAELSAARSEIWFDFYAQRFVDDWGTPIEDSKVEWTEDVFPARTCRENHRARKAARRSIAVLERVTELINFHTFRNQLLFHCDGLYERKVGACNSSADKGGVDLELRVWGSGVRIPSGAPMT